MDTQRKTSETRWRARCLVFLSLWSASFGLQTGCKAFWPVVAVPVSLPALPTVWSEADGWELDWRCLDTVGEARMAVPGDTLVLFLPRTSSAAIRCKPVFGISRGLPYGAIWPLDVDPEGGLSLRAAGGLSAELAFRLYQGGYDAAKFNLRRFVGEAEFRIADPWERDIAVLARAVAEGRFRVDYLMTPGKTAVLVAGLAGDMSPDSPWGKPIKPDAQGQATVSIPPGVHRWFGYGRELIVSVSSDGSAEWILRGTDGRVMQKVLP